ncbi:protein KRI1 homolog [Cinclus cinclus]|uniref:protein KRI1 homolog n=1 Tax=Cinclus cinclus TaxID=127875 RepID=UPI002E0D5F38
MAEPKLRVNAAFAERYGRYRRREELQRLRDRYGDTGDSGDSDSDSSESSGDDVALDPREEREFYRTLALLKTRDPRIYREDTTFYTREESEEEEEEDEEGEEERPAKPMFLKDYERKVVLEKEGKYVDEEDEEDEEAAAKRRKVESSQSYAEEQRALKESFRAFVADSEEEEEEEEGGALLRPRIRSQKEKDQEEEQYLRWLRGQAEAPPEPLQDLEPLQKFWSDPALEPGERFLRDYLLGNGFREEEEEEGDEGASLPSLEDSSDEGEQFLERQQEFERRHNFRFEEPGAAQIQTFPRQIPTSVRRRDERRKEKREQIRERKKKERARRREELKQLKNLKREELAARIARIRDASGSDAFGLSHSLLQEDFDPAHHDRLMAEWFGEEYYGRGEEEKPQFEEEEGLDDDWNWDSWTGREEEESQTEPHCEDPDFVMDADYVPEPPPAQAPPEVSFGKKRRKTRFREALEREKPPFDPASGPFEQYLDEFYGLDFEDMIGDLPCRFKYRRVLPCDFGLTTDEILAADDKELNRWCSLRKTCMYRSEQEERQDQANYSRRAQNLGKKHQILRSLAADPQEPEVAPAKPKFGKKRREKRKRLEEAGKGESPEAPPTTPQNLGAPRRRGGAPLGAAVRLGGREFSGKRLEAFGLNPRRLRFRQLRRQQGKERGVKPGEPPEKPQKKPGNTGKNPGKTAGVNGKKQKRRKKAPTSEKNT